MDIVAKTDITNLNIQFSISMATRMVFSDDDNNEMDCYLNDKGRVYISVGQSGEDNIYSGFITLDKEDVSKLIKALSELEEQMPA